jgi:quercetin 2,3-dioxygenase
MERNPMERNPILHAQALGFPWATQDPFLFCAYHDDAYPLGNAQLGPDASLRGRDIGQDFSRKDGWSMYHGTEVPGFPSHPHRGFETVTIVRKGLIDHSDSLGAAARFGGGDVQWLTAGKGIVHSEMFPLLNRNAENPLELFQIWLNLPAKNKMVEPHFTMMWREQIPAVSLKDERGRTTVVSVIAGEFDAHGEQAKALDPPPDSWASQTDAGVAIWTIKIEAGARFTLPKAIGEATGRRLYFFKGDSLLIAGQKLAAHALLDLDASQNVEILNGDVDSEFLMLQGKPIAEPIAQHGPFVMNTEQEIRQAMSDYQRTQFGGWPWPEDSPVHGVEPVRFAKHPDGRLEKMQNHADSTK